MDVEEISKGTETKSMRTVVGILLIIIVGATSQAQMDSVLLKGSEKPPQEAGLAAGRYQVREVPPLEAEEAKPKLKPSKKWKRKTASEPAIAAGAAAEKKPVNVPVIAVPVAPALEQPSVAEQVKDLVSGNGQPSIEAYKEQVHPDDVRLNRVEISIGPGLIYSDSKSTYSYRNFTSFSPVAKAGGAIWITPFIGIYGSYLTTVGGDISENTPTNSHVPMTHEIIDLGVDWRRFFGLSRKSNVVSFGFHYFEDKIRVPGDNTNRAGTKSTGLGIHFQARLPVAPSYAWVFGGRMEPRLSHGEVPTQLILHSGDSPESSRVGLNLGGEFKMSRQNQIVWDLSLTIEKNQFNGSASPVDPSTGVATSGVSVTNATSIFSLGYRWGK